MKPAIEIRRLQKKGSYRVLSFEENEEEVGYCCLFLHSCGDVLLDYLAVEPRLRGQGMGTRILAELRTVLSDRRGIFIECEAPGAGEKDRLRRIAFYTDSGAIRTGIMLRLFGVVYEILYLPLGEKDASRTRVRDIYREMMHPLAMRHLTFLREDGME